jgi:hypothetical protein
VISRHEWRWDLVSHYLHEDISFSSTKPKPQPMIPQNLQLFTLNTRESKILRSTTSIMTLLSHLQNVAHIWDMKASYSSSSSSILFVDGCKSLQNQINLLSQQEKPKLLWVTDDYEFESLRLACVIYSNNGADLYQTRSDRRQAQLRELHELLNYTDISNYWKDIPGALIWCLAVGVNQSWDCSEYSWFMAHLMPMLMMLAMQCWNELERTLDTFKWLFKCCRNGAVLPRS